MSLHKCYTHDGRAELCRSAEWIGDKSIARQSDVTQAGQTRQQPFLQRHHQTCPQTLNGKTRKQSEPTDLCQDHVVRQVAAPSSVLQRFPLCPIESNVNDNFKVIQNPGFLPDHPQNWITGSFCHSRHSQKISERSVHNFLSYLADTQTDRQTDKQSLAKT